jgi:uncharacterized protein (TIGR03086 family)
MVGLNYGYAATADGDIRDGADFADRPVSDQPAADYAGSARALVEAFGSPSLVGRTLFLPPVRGGMTVSAPLAMGMNLTNVVAHGWDVAKSLGIAAEFDEDALRVALKVAQAVPAAAQSVHEHSPFLPSVPSSSTSMLDRVVASLGRSPDWTPPT